MTKTKNKLPRIRAWKDEGFPSYVVQVGEDMYEMGAGANMPNGVCIYLGRSDDLAWTVRDKPVNNIPVGIVHKIMELIMQENR